VLATTVDWAALAQAAWVSAVIGLGILIVGAVGVAASLRAQDDRTAGASGAAVVFGGITIACVAGLIGAVVYGIYLLTQ
jgi:hypothetical protein